MRRLLKIKRVFATLFVNRVYRTFLIFHVPSSFFYGLMTIRLAVPKNGNQSRLSFVTVSLKTKIYFWICVRMFELQIHWSQNWSLRTNLMTLLAVKLDCINAFTDNRAFVEDFSKTFLFIRWRRLWCYDFHHMQVVKRRDYFRVLNRFRFH